MTTPDPLAGELAAIRERASQITDEHGPGDCDLNGGPCTGHDAERLAAAVEAVLALHQPGPFVILGYLCPAHASHRHFSITDPEAAGVRACPDCTADARRSCKGCDGRPCPTYRAVAAALMGEASGA